VTPADPNFGESAVLMLTRFDLERPYSAW